MLESVRAVLENPLADPNGVGNHWPPLKMAIMRGHAAVVTELLNHPKTKRELHPSGISCEDLKRIPDGIVLMWDATAPDCVKQHPSFRQVTGTNMFKKSDEYNDGLNPFQPLTTGQRPRRDVYVMNPATFENILDAVRYYLFGNPWSGVEVAVMVVLVVLQVCLMTAVLWFTRG
jgi:hypothetical protein